MRYDNPATDSTACLGYLSAAKAAVDELYHFLQYLEFKYQLDLEVTLEALEDEIDGFDADVALQEPGEVSLASFKQELGSE